MISVQLQIDGLGGSESIPKKSRSYPQGSRVSLTALREKVRAIVTVVTCGEKLRGCSERLDRVGSSARIRPVCFQERISGISEECFPTLPRWGILSGGEYGALATSERRTSATECLLWHTPMASDGKLSTQTNENLIKGWANRPNKHLSEQVAYTELQGGGCSIRETFPTPTVADSKNVGYNGSHQFNLHKYVAIFPTPVASGKLSGGTGAHEKLKDMKACGQITEEERRSMSAGNGGKLNPTWVEWLMGFPLGWTSLDVSETQ